MTVAEMRLIAGVRWNERDGVHDGYTCDAEHWESFQGCAPVFAGAALPRADGSIVTVNRDDLLLVLLTTWAEEQDQPRREAIDRLRSHFEQGA